LQQFYTKGAVYLSQPRFCHECGQPTEPFVRGDEQRNHRFCAHCGEPRYQHPMIVVTSFVAWEDRLLWVQRDIEPKRGMWAIPGGYLERGETLAQGAARELREEAGIALPPEQLNLYMIGTLTFINQIYIAFRAAVDCGYYQAGPESQACGFFSRQECPWDQVAYPEVNVTVEQAYDDLAQGKFGVWHTEMTSERLDFLPVSQ